MCDNILDENLAASESGGGGGGGGGIWCECKSTRQGALSVRAQGQGFLISQNVNAMQYKI